MSFAAVIGGLNVPDTLLFIAVGLVVLVVTLFVARLAARIATDQLSKRHVRGDMVVLGRRIAMGVVVLFGIFAALGFAVQNANVTLFGLLLGTIVAALGVQQLLQDYVSGYYVLLERHLRVGDRIAFDGHDATITEVRLRVTLLRNDSGDTVIVPNSELFTKPVTIRARAEAAAGVTTPSAPPT
jgi:small-conductance mechanosensitive channel